MKLMFFLFYTIPLLSSSSRFCYSLLLLSSLLLQFTLLYSPLYSSVLLYSLLFPSLLFPSTFRLISSLPLYFSLFLSIHLLLSSHLPVFPSSLSKAGDNGGQAYIKVFTPTSFPTAAPVLKPGESYPPTMIPTTSIPTYAIFPNTFIHLIFYFIENCQHVNRTIS